VDRKQHWERVYTGKPVSETSWHQVVPAPSLVMIRNAASGRKPSLIDIGGGASLLVDCLLDEGYEDLAVLDVSGTALHQARQRLGPRAAMVEWFEADVTAFEPSRSWEIWHDRAAFHFLTDAADRRRYVAALHRGLADGGQAVIGAFALDGPEKCSGLDIVRYDAHSLGAELGESFQLEEQLAEKHLTPAGREQRFGFYRFRKVGRGRLGA
jgi:SAM-dependent methyltransferase